MIDLVLVGGYLGAGKTTLILRAARMLQQRGRRPAVILNDQDTGLVDTRFARAAGVPAAEVAGGCFCCRFSDLLDAADQLRAYAPDVLFAEPAGSCIDVSATVLQPLKAYHGDVYRLAPLTVLVDSGRAPDYLARNQIDEADIVCAAKSDVYPDPGFPSDFHVSSITGQGIEPWLEEVLSGRRVAGSRILSVDYDRYAAEEAALGWLNLHANLRFDDPRSPSLVAGPLLDGLEGQLPAISHLKIFDQTPTGYVKAALTATGQEPTAEGDLLADPAADHELVINLRAPADPEELLAIVRRALNALGAAVEIRHENAFRPSYPRPQHRFTSAV